MYEKYSHAKGSIIGLYSILTMTPPARVSIASTRSSCGWSVLQDLENL